MPPQYGLKMVAPVQLTMFSVIQFFIVPWHQDFVFKVPLQSQKMLSRFISE